MKLILGRQNGEENTYLSTKGKLSLLISQTTKEEADLPSPMTCLGLSQKPAASFSEKAEMMATSKHKPSHGTSWKWDDPIIKARVGFWHLTRNLEFPLKKPLVAEEAGCVSSCSQGRRSGEFPGQSPPQVLENILSGSAPLPQACCCRFCEAVVYRIKWINGSLNKRTTI